LSLVSRSKFFIGAFEFAQSEIAFGTREGIGAPNETGKAHIRGIRPSMPLLGLAFVGNRFRP
jgi:hypothetical protein